MRATIVRTQAEPSFFTAPRVIAVCVASAVLLMGGIATGGWLLNRWSADPTEAPICYSPDQANYTPLDEAIPLRGAVGLRGDRSIDQRIEKTSPEKMDAAEAACKIGACGREGSLTYRSAIFWYLSGRLQHTRQLDRTYGQTGLRRAVEIYSEPFDERVEKGLRDRYRAGVFRFSDFPQYREAVMILVLKGGAALRPCRKADIARR
ncbi:MAG: hypothetical protein QOC56_660 [Alphaproteobacteria bacterium]|nr:hypothetical protein [Alphaproteobacteria bacterium]